MRMRGVYHGESVHVQHDGLVEECKDGRASVKDHTDLLQHTEAKNGLHHFSQERPAITKMLLITKRLQDGRVIVQDHVDLLRHTETDAEMGREMDMETVTG